MDEGWGLSMSVRLFPEVLIQHASIGGFLDLTPLWKKCSLWSRDRMSCLPVFQLIIAFSELCINYRCR